MQTLESFNSIPFIKMLEDNILDESAELAYSLHKEKYDNDSIFIKNKIPPAPDTTLMNFKKDDFFSSSYHGYVRNKKIPKGSENSEVLDGSVHTSDPLNEFIRNELGLKEVFARCLIQEPGKCISVHVDYNRNFFGPRKEKLKDLPCGDVKKYVWFLEDQEIGQMWAIGRDNISWKAGDIYQWNWYMPHATANSSNYNRKLLIIIGYH